MERAHWHVFQILTKRNSLMHRYVNQRYVGARAPEHIWLGVSIEDTLALTRVTHLKETHARVPLGHRWWRKRLGRAPGHARMGSVRYAISAAHNGSAFFFKQWGGKTSRAGGNRLDRRYWMQYPRVSRESLVAGYSGT